MSMIGSCQSSVEWHKVRLNRAEPHTSYVNAEMISTELPSLADGFAAMTGICQDALSQLAERMLTPYMSASWPASCQLQWSDFELSDDSQPRLVHQNVSYYRARHCSLAPSGCVLMV